MIWKLIVKDKCNIAGNKHLGFILPYTSCALDTTSHNSFHQWPDIFVFKTSKLKKSEKLKIMDTIFKNFSWYISHFMQHVLFEKY